MRFNLDDLLGKTGRGLISAGPQTGGPPPTPTPTVAPSGPIDNSAPYQVNAGHAVYFLNSGGFDSSASITNAGVITDIATTDGAWAVAFAAALPPGGSVITNTSTGKIYVNSTGGQSPEAIALDFSADLALAVDNAGLIQVVCATGYAFGEHSWVSGDGFTNEATGSLIVYGGQGATGLWDINGLPVVNNGLIQVTGPNAVGVLGASSFTNNGTLIATDPTAGANSIGVELYINSGVGYVNNGTIQANYAFYTDQSSQSPPYEPNVTISNKGQIDGIIDLGDGDTTIWNQGGIVGAIDFGNGHNQYHGGSGAQSGGLYLGQGSSTIQLGDDGETVFNAGGSDTITGGAGNDFIEVMRNSNVIDGGGGFNILSFADSDAGVTVNLGAGTASAAGTDSIKNIQEVIASGYASTLIAGAAAAELVGGAAYDTLTGGAGNDTLVAGTGGAVMTGGGGADTFVVSAGDHQVVITDFNLGQDGLDIYGYASATSIQQQGSDALITLSATDTILLKGVQAASIPAADLIYKVGAFATGASTLPAPAGFGTSEIAATSNLTIAAGEHIAPVNQGVAIFDTGDATPANNAPALLSSIDNFGSIVLATTAGSGAIGIYCDTTLFGAGVISGGPQPTFTNEAGATFSVSDPNGPATGVEEDSWGVDVVNGGTFTVSGSTDVCGVFTYSTGVTVQNTKTGALAVTATAGSAYGLYGSSDENGSEVLENDGTVTVAGVGAVYGVYDAALTNTGVLTVTASGPNAHSYGLAIAGVYSPKTPTMISNSGVITAQTAITEFDPGLSPSQTPALDVVNSGTINGDILFGVGDNQVHNTGLINGQIVFQTGDVVYDGAQGTLKGDIVLGLGASTVTLGNDGETVISAYGDDTLTGGAGNDLIVVGRGQKTIDGGGGFNILSFAEADGAVTVDLGAGVATGVGQDSLKNIQAVVGGAYNDTLKAGAAGAELVGGTGDDTLVGGGGDDTLVAGAGGATATGGGGHNTFVFSAGDHQLVITDFDAGGDQDSLKIDGYTGAQSVQQQGANTLIVLSAQDSVLLDNVQAASLTAANLSYASAAWSLGVTLPAAPAPFGASTIALQTPPLKIAAGETVAFANTVNIGFSDAIFSNVSLDIAGAAVVAPLSGAAYGLSSSGVGGTVTLDAGAKLNVTVASANSATAYGFYCESNQLPAIVNNGAVTVSGPSASYGLYEYGGGTAFTNGAAGVLNVTGSYAVGVWGNYSFHSIENDGVINVISANTAIGIDYAETFNGSITNTGLLNVAGGVGIQLQSDYNDLIPINNSGTIKAATAINVTPSQLTNFPKLAITNSGTIDGDINLASSPSTLTSTGLIVGDIRLSEGPATIDMRAGVFDGAILIAPTSGFPSYAANPTDVFHTGAGDNEVDIAGGVPGLTASITGGGHTTVKLDEASTAATLVHNADGSWSLSGGADGALTLTGVQAVQFSDTTVSLAPAPNSILIGGPGTDSWLGGGGGDLVVGGGGANTVVFNMASSAATWSRNPDGSWTIVAGAAGIETVLDVQFLKFTDRTISLPAPASGEGETVVSKANGNVMTQQTYAPWGPLVSTTTITLSPGVTIADVYDANQTLVGATISQSSPGTAVVQHFDGHWNQLDATRTLQLGGGAYEVQYFDANWIQTSGLIVTTSGATTITQAFNAAWVQTGATSVTVNGAATITQAFNAAWGMTGASIVTVSGGATITQTFNAAWAQTGASIVTVNGNSTETQTFDANWAQTGASIVTVNGAQTRTQTFDAHWAFTGAAIVTLGAGTTETQVFDAHWSQTSATMVTVSGATTQTQQFDGAWNQTSATTDTFVGSAVVAHRIDSFDGAWNRLAEVDTAEADSGVTFDFGAAGHVTFKGASTSLGGDTLLNFGRAGDAIDLTDIAATGPAPSFVEDASNTFGTLTVTGGGHTASITLFGQYMAAGFSAASDGGSGALITYSPPLSGQAIAAPH